MGMWYPHILGKVRGPAMAEKKTSKKATAAASKTQSSPKTTPKKDAGSAPSKKK
jgi:hypothetical protein